MKQEQFQQLVKVIEGTTSDKIPTGFIIDSPWLPQWHGVSVIDYFASDEIWFKANLKAVETFPDTIFLPGFWAEYGMCTEPSAFGSKCRWEEKSLPHPKAISSDIKVLCQLDNPDVSKDGLLPFVIRRLKNMQPRISDAGHSIKFAVSRGPLNIASFLMGTTEFLTAMMIAPDECHRLISNITDFLVDWIGYQIEQLPSIEGVLLLDDIIGFVGQQQCRDYVVPYFKRIFSAFNAKVNFLHNDANGLVCAPFLQEMGVNLFNYSFEHSIKQMKELTSSKVTLLGNIPPRDVLASGTPADINNAVRRAMTDVPERSRVILSCGGGMPQGVSTENIRAFIEASGHI